jgi:hypothetical protein
MPKYISPLNVIKGIEKCGMRNRLGGHQLVRSTNHYTKTYNIIVFIQMELNFHKSNSFFWVN